MSTTPIIKKLEELFRRLSQSVNQTIVLNFTSQDFQMSPMSCSCSCFFNILEPADVGGLNVANDYVAAAFVCLNFDWGISFLLWCLINWTPWYDILPSNAQFIIVVQVNWLSVTSYTWQHYRISHSCPSDLTPLNNDELSTDSRWNRIKPERL